MDADKHVYEIFQAYPQWVYELLQRPSPGNCRFLSVVIKAIERRADGVLIPDAIEEPIWIIEFQLQWDAWIYNRIAVEMAMVQEEHEGREVCGAIIFGAKDLDPKTEPWCQIVSSFYLDTMLTELGKSSPGHPLVAVFQPLVNAIHARLQ